MNNYKIFYLGFLPALIFNICEPCFSLPHDQHLLRISEAQIFLPLEITHTSSPFNQNNRIQKKPTLNDIPPSYGRSYNPLEDAVCSQMSSDQFKEHFECELN